MSASSLPTTAPDVVFRTEDAHVSLLSPNQDTSSSPLTHASNAPLDDAATPLCSNHDLKDTSDIEHEVIPELLDGSYGVELSLENCRVGSEDTQDEEQRLRLILANWLCAWADIGTAQDGPLVMKSCSAFHVGHNIRLPEVSEEFESATGDSDQETDRSAAFLEETHGNWMNVAAKQSRRLCQHQKHFKDQDIVWHSAHGSCAQSMASQMHNILLHPIRSLRPQSPASPASPPSPPSPPSTPPIMKHGSTRRIIFDSSSEPETDKRLSPNDDTTPTLPTSDAASHHRTSSKTSPMAASDSESEFQNQPKKKGRKPKPKLPNTVEEDDQSGKSKRISWNAFPSQATFLEKTLEDILRADKQQRRALKKKAKKEFHKRWPTLGEYTHDEVEKSINNWFKNHIQFPHLRKNQSAITPEVPDASDDDSGPSFSTRAQPAPARSISDATSVALAPLLKSIRRRARGPSGWWALEHRAEVSALRAKLGGDIGALKTAVRQLYSPLSEAEKAKWEEKAADEKAKQSQDETQCFRNQDDFPLLVATLLDSFIGYDPQQVGSALVYFRIAMRTESGAIQHDQYTVGLPEDADSFDLFAGGPKQDEIDRWADYVDVVLPKNPPRRDERLTYEADGLPKLPPYDDEWTVAQARSALEVWFQAMWNYGLEHGVDLPNGLDWSNFANTVAPYVPTAWTERVIAKPSDRPFHHVVTLYHNLFEAQDTPDAFRWNALTPSTSTYAVSANRAPPHTPSKTIYTTYTTPTKPSAPTPSAAVRITRNSPSTPPLPRLIFPAIDALADSDATMPASSSNPADERHDQGSGSGVVGITAPTAGMAIHAASMDSGAVAESVFDDVWASPLGDTDVANKHAGQTTSTTISEAIAASNTDPMPRPTPASPSPVDGSLAAAKNTSRREDGDAHKVNAFITDEGGAPAGPSTERIGDADAPPLPSHGNNEIMDASDAVTDSGKRKHPSQSSVPASKRPKTLASQKELESISPVSRRTVRPRPPPAGSPRKTRATAEREAREAREADELRKVNLVREARDAGEGNEGREAGAAGNAGETGETGETHEAGATHEARETHDSARERDEVREGDEARQARELGGALALVNVRQTRSRR